MIPLGDASRRRLHFPTATVSIIGLNFIVFFFELSGGDAFINRWSLVPAEIVAGHGWITILTAMFMHAGWEHILGNMLFLWVFGPAIEDAMGSTRYTVFYLLGGCAATFAQIAVNPSSTIPNLGASGAIAAVMGVFLITYPRDRIKTVASHWMVRQYSIYPGDIIGWAVVPYAIIQPGRCPGSNGHQRRSLHGARGRFSFWNDCRKAF